MNKEDLRYFSELAGFVGGRPISAPLHDRLTQKEGRENLFSLASFFVISFGKDRFLAIPSRSIYDAERQTAQTPPSVPRY